jgi:hypothetical protein
MSRIIAPFVLLLLLAAAAPSVALPQAASTTPLTRLTPGAVIRATLVSGRIVTGRLAQLGDGRLGVRSDAGSTDSIRLDQVIQVSVRGRHTKTGAVVGGLVGIGVGVFVGVVVNAVCEGGSHCDGAEPYTIAIPLFGGGAALVGAAVGSAFPKWRRVFP